jgi:hypothetical protein
MSQKSKSEQMDELNFNEIVTAVFSEEVVLIFDGKVISAGSIDPEKRVYDPLENLGDIMRAVMRSSVVFIVKGKVVFALPHTSETGGLELPELPANICFGLHAPTIG